MIFNLVVRALNGEFHWFGLITNGIGADVNYRPGVCSLLVAE